MAKHKVEKSVYCRKLEDHSGFVVCFGGFLPPEATSFIGGRDRWEEVLGVGSTQIKAWADYQMRNRT